MLMPVAGTLSQATASALHAPSKVNPAVAGHVVQAFDVPMLDGDD